MFRKRWVRTSIDFAHSQTHRGLLFTASQTFSVDTASSVTLFLKTGETWGPHTAFRVASGADARIELFEGTTVSSNGTAVSVFNNNRTSSTISEPTVFHTPTITGVGTLIFDGLNPGGSRGNAVGGVFHGALRKGAEWILNMSTNYLMRVTNLSLATEDITIGCSFYEVDPADFLL